MKNLSRSLVALLVTGILLVLHTTAFAAQEQRMLGDRFSLSIGYKVWVAKWKSVQSFPANFFAAGQPSFVEELNSKTTVLQGPTITGLLKVQEGP